MSVNARGSDGKDGRGLLANSVVLNGLIEQTFKI